MARMGLLLLCAGAVVGTPAIAQDYPARAIRIIVPFPAGGTADLLPRIVGEKLAASWGQPVIIDNRAGAAGNIGAEMVYNAEPDGYTLLAAPPPPLVINPSLYPKLAFDPTRFVPVTVMARVPNALVINPKLNVKDVGEFIAYARALTEAYTDRLAALARAFPISRIADTVYPVQFAVPNAVQHQADHNAGMAHPTTPWPIALAQR